MKTKWGQKIQELIEKQGVTADSISQKANMSPSTLSGIINGRNQSLKDRYRIALAGAFGMTDESFSKYIYGIEDIQSSGLVDLPHIGYITAGIPVDVYQQELGILKLPSEYFRGKNMSKIFALTVSGDSLQGDGISNGDYAIVERDAEIINGKIYVVKLENEIVARHVWKRDGELRLVAANGDYTDILADKVEVQGRIIMRFNPPLKF